MSVRPTSVHFWHSRTLAAALAAMATLVLWPAENGSVRAEPRMPGGFEARWAQERNNTWRESGALDEVYASGVRTVETCLEGQGYRLQYDIPVAGGGRVLQQWEKEGERIIVMLWEMKDGRTGCSWGVSE